MVTEYQVSQDITLNVQHIDVDLRCRDLNSSEVDRGYREIGGDRGDLRFSGFTYDEGEEVVTLVDPVLLTTLELDDEEDIFEIAQDVLNYSFESIGIESVY